jgi:hypothetical protein
VPRARKPEVAVRKTFERACILYEELAATLTGIIAELREASATRALSRAELDVVKAHQKTVLLVLDFEAQLLKRRLGAASEPGKPLDLDAARTEIAGRMARLAAGA